MIYCAFLQGINIGKHNRIKMADLKYMFESMGFKNVHTYLQNGNVLFESKKDELTLRKMIEREIVIVYRYVVPVILRSSIELENVIKNCPFSKEEIKEAELSSGEGLYVSFLKQIPSEDNIEILQTYNNGDEFEIVGRDLYLLFPTHTIRSSILVRNLNKIDVHATVRSIRTIKKLLHVIKKIETIHL